MNRKIQLITAKIALLCIPAIMLIVSCKNVSEKAAEKIMEKAIEKASGEEVDIDYEDEKVVIETEEGNFEVDANANSWPKEIPSGVPEFKHGKITALTTNDTEFVEGWTIVFTDVQGDAIDKYNAELKKKGFETQTVNMPGMGGSINGKNKELIIAVFAGEGDATVSIQVTKE